MYKIYRVVEGDTLNSIAYALNVTPELLASLNGINITDSLTPNSYIVVPANNQYFNTYIIKPNDTIYEIASHYNIEPNNLLKLNGLDEKDYIYPNEEILVPKPTTKLYITKNKDTLNTLEQELKVDISDIAKQNQTIYLVEDQLILYK